MTSGFPDAIAHVEGPYKHNTLVNTRCQLAVTDNLSKLLTYVHRVSMLLTTLILHVMQLNLVAFNTYNVYINAVLFNVSLKQFVPYIHALQFALKRCNMHSLCHRAIITYGSWTQCVLLFIT